MAGLIMATEELAMNAKIERGQGLPNQTGPKLQSVQHLPIFARSVGEVERERAR